MLGLCELEDVGEERPVELPPRLPEPPAEPAAPMTREQRKAKVQRILDDILHAIAANPAGALDDNGSTINKLIDLASKFDDQPEPKRKPVAQMTRMELQRAILTGLTPDTWEPFWIELERALQAGAALPTVEDRRQHVATTLEAMKVVPDWLKTC